MQCFVVILLLVLDFHPSGCLNPSCRTNCSTGDENCWRTALTYRSSELIEQLFSFSSLAVHVETYRFHHQHQINDSVQFIAQALDEHLKNQSFDLQLFQVAKQRLLSLCQNLTSTPVTTVDQLPPLSCSSATCASDALNYLLLLIISTVIAGLILVICVIQTYQTRQRSRVPHPVHAEGPLINSLSTTHTTVNV